MSSQTISSPWRLEWSDELSVCIPEIDAEHKHFIMLINELNRSIISRMGIEEIKSCMSAILDDAVAHFTHEETLFRQWNYPEAEDHAEKHAQLTQALHEIMSTFERGGFDCEWIEAGLKVKQALVAHLLNEDMKYRDYCLKNNLSSSC